MGNYKAAQRKKFAVVKVDGESKFPIGDKAHARAALARIGQEKPPLTAGQKAKVKGRARSMLRKGK